MLKYIIIATWLLISEFSASASTPDYASLYAIHSESVVTVHTLSMTAGEERPTIGLGSGVLINQSRILTAAHVVQSADLIRIQFHDGTQIPAVVLSSIESSDIALLKLARAHPAPVVATLGDSSKARIGEPVFIIGSPFGLTQTLSIGHLSGRIERGLVAGGTPIELLQTDTAINSGNSGGPMFNAAGEVIGIVSFILSKGGGFDGIGFATSSNTAEEALLNSSGLLAGFEGVFLDEFLASLLNIPQTGILVQRVVNDSIAQKAGLRAGTVPSQIGGQNLRLGGDVILEINGVACHSPHELQALSDSSATLSADNTYSLLVFRDGKTVELIAGPARHEDVLFGNKQLKLGDDALDRTTASRRRPVVQLLLCHP
jgi:serine protease Do